MTNKTITAKGINIRTTLGINENDYISITDIANVANEMPSRVHGLVVRDDGQDYIYINANSSRAMQEEAYRHEQEHIKHGDLDSSLPVSTLEANR